MEIMDLKNPDIAFWKDKKVFVTGHTGFKGSWLCLLLDHLGAKVYGYALDPPTVPSLYNLCNINDVVDSTIADIRDSEKLHLALKLAQPEIVIHMAAQPLVRLSYSDPVGTFQTNLMGSVNLLEAVRTTESVRVVVNVTTDKCYENKEWLWPYRENEPLGGYDPYSGSKACAEIITAAYRNSFFNVKTPFLSKRKLSDPFVPRLPPCLLKADRTAATVLLLLSVRHSTKTAIPPGA